MSNPIFVAYVGQSMSPTLVEPELLEIDAYGQQAPRVGDVIYFRAPTDAADTVHRIVAITPAGIRTRGDNNPCADHWLVQPSMIIGRVAAALRGTSRRVVLGGRRGLALHFYLRVWRSFDTRISRVLYGPYHALARSGLTRKLLPARWRPRVVVFQETRLLILGTRVIGRYDAQRRIWQIRRPFRLFVDKAKLP